MTRMESVDRICRLAVWTRMRELRAVQGIIIHRVVPMSVPASAYFIPKTRGTMSGPRAVPRNPSRPPKRNMKRMMLST